MAERRLLIEGLNPKPSIERSLEHGFVFQEKAPATEPASMTAGQVPESSPAASERATQLGNRAPLTTRLRSDFAAALKRASLERQLQGTDPHTVQEILEAALEPWLRANGYVP